MIQVVRHPNGRRLLLRGRRLHHGRTGQILVIVGLLLMLDDLHDFPWRFEIEIR